MFSMSGGTSSNKFWSTGMKQDLDTLSVDIFRALNNIYPKDAHPID